MENEKKSLWDNIGEAIYSVRRLEKQIPKIKENIEIAKENKAASLGILAFAAYGKSDLPGSKAASSLMEIILTQKVKLPWEGVTIGKYKTNTIAEYSSKIGGLEYKKEPAFGIQFSKRF